MARSQHVPASRAKITGLALGVVFGFAALPLHAQELAGLPPLPVWRTPPADLADPDTLIAGHFDGTPACDGANLLKSTLEPLRGGPSGFGAVRFPAQGAVSIHRSDGFDPRQGTIELWLRPGSDPGRRRNLFSLSGAASLDGDTLTDLFVGGASPDSSSTFSHLYFGRRGVVDRENPALIETRVPRGLAAGDLDGDGVDDLVITAHVDGWVDFVPGPLCPGRIYERPYGVRRLVQVVEPQGLALADLEGDGDLDLLVCSYGALTHPLMIFENDGHGGMTLTDTAFGGWLSPSEGLALADFDRDGVLDVVFATLGRGLPSAVVFGSLEEDGSYRLVVDDPERRFALADQALGVSVADLDGDGWQDIVLARVNAHELAIHMNRGGRF
ncbi:MAG: VCBS repeat-containing protein, partial [Planctomycetota bacterium]|nr:VCBS repeat-containing protein [Planctomycetota bacterium]